MEINIFEIFLKLNLIYNLKKKDSFNQLFQIYFQCINKKYIKINNVMNELNIKIIS